MQNLRFLTFEIGSDCGLARLHEKCPVSDPERYLFGQHERRIDDELVLGFWRRMRQLGFRGTVLWHLYNEPSKENARIQGLMATMRAEAPNQTFHLWTNNHTQFEGYDFIKLTDYRVVRPSDLDDRRRTTKGEGDWHTVRAREPRGGCSRAENWEFIVDNRGNVLMCCNDWRCEGSFGCLFTEDWDTVIGKWQAKAAIEWTDRASFEALPRICRACVTYNPNLHNTAIPYRELGK